MTVPDAGVPGEQRNDEPWRVGRSYQLHVYAVGPTSPTNDRPVATFHTTEDAAAAVEARNASQTEVLIEGSFFPVADLPETVGNLLRRSDENSRREKEAYLRTEALRVELQEARDEADEWKRTTWYFDAQSRRRKADLAAARRTLDRVAAVADAIENLGRIHAAPLAVQLREIASGQSSPDTDTRNQCRICQGDDGKHDGAIHDAYVADRPANTWPADTRNEGERHG